MKRSTRFAGLGLALVGAMVLSNNLAKPRMDSLHGADILGLIASGFCFGIAFVALIGRLNLRNDS